ncbi:hypothetical protein GCM10010492_59810 [Saccharothrix mutabilis subsp. mutabilis]|uniref:Uncharacterized protein n=1 Tax=Saccharothrix mutabilis subsp. mutabilis TaxID=66855 RepID=A0ABN0UI51_9PSEU
MSGGLLALALLTVPGTGAAQALLAHTGLDATDLVDAALSHLVGPDEYPDYEDWSSSIEHVGSVQRSR